MAASDYKNSIKEINKLYTDRAKRAAARSFMLSCKESGIAYNVALDLLKSSAAVPASDQIADKNTLKPSETEFITRNAEQVENIPLSGEIIGNGQNITDNDIDFGSLSLSDIQNKIYMALDDFIAQNNIQDMKKEPFRIWRAASSYIGTHVFKNTDILRQVKPTYNGSAVLTTSNSYNYKAVAAVLNFYIYLCDNYNKPITIDSSEMFLGVHDGFLSERREKVTLSGCDLWKKSEASIAAGIVDGKVNPTGALAHLNHYYNWNDTVKQTEKTQNNVYIFPALGKLSPGVVPELPQVTE